jgi:putative transposase
MPGRPHLLVTSEYYYVFNKTVDGKRPLEDRRMLQKFKEIAWYYRSTATSHCYADFIRLADLRRSEESSMLSDPGSFRVEILAYCFMPTHFHFLLRQQIDGGISMYISQIQNSFTRYFNTLNNRKGPLFIHRFRSRPIESDGDLKHISRYIHLNPYSSGVVPDVDSVLSYPGSSFHELSRDNLDTRLTPGVDELPYVESSYANYKQFVVQNADYQKSLENVME